MLARPAGRMLLAVSALLFAASAAPTIAGAAGMAGMGDMPMPGGWTMSMAWMRPPGETWLGAGAAFLGMWTPMMVAMMLPSLVPALWRHLRADAPEGGPRRRALRTGIVGVGYFAVWTALGAAVFPLGAALAALEMRSAAVARAVPGAIGAVVLVAGALQLTRWKARHLACCREGPGPDPAPNADAGAALRRGLRLGLHCVRCCAGPTAALLALGVMDLAAMGLATAVITAERLAPGAGGLRVARASGVAAVGAGALLVARALGT